MSVVHPLTKATKILILAGTERVVHNNNSAVEIMSKGTVEVAFNAVAFFD